MLFDHALQRVERARWKVNRERLRAICEALPSLTQQTLHKALAAALLAESGAPLTSSAVIGISSELRKHWQQWRQAQLNVSSDRSPPNESPDTTPLEEGEPELFDLSTQQPRKRGGRGERAGRSGGGEVPTTVKKSNLAASVKAEASSKASCAARDAGDLPLSAQGGGANAFDAARSARDSQSQSQQKSTSRTPLILMLDEPLQALPWESIPLLRGHPVCRLPCAGFVGQCADAAAKLSASNGAACLNSAYYVLNPSGDLQRTQQTLQGQIARPPWEGVVGEPPDSALLKVSLQCWLSHPYFLHPSPAFVQSVHGR